MSDLGDIIRAEIFRDGAISFAWFMELCLYCPNFGYYERPEVRPGQKGDFYTSVSVGGLFGELLANQFADWALGVFPDGQSAGWQIVEAGAHDGRLAMDVLGWLKEERTELFEKLDYWVLEPSANRKAIQEKMLGEFVGKVRWFESWEKVPPGGVNGVIFSNELLDAMPAHRMGWDAAGRKWFEWGVIVNGNELAWKKLFEADDSDLPKSAIRNPQSAMPRLPTDLLDVLPDNFTTEICPAAADWWRGAARALNAGRLVTIDYGLRAEEFFSPGRKDGTLRAYYRHHQGNDLLARPGEQDLTAHVNFSAIQASGEAECLKTKSLITQSQFLTGIIEKNCCHNPTVKEWTPPRVRQFQTLTHPEHLGQRFKVLVQGR